MASRSSVSRSLLSTLPRRLSSPNPRKKETIKDIQKGSGQGSLVIRHGDDQSLLPDFTRAFYARYADNLLVGIMGCRENLEKRIAHFLQSGLNQGLDCRIQTQRSTEFLGYVVKEIPPKNPMQVLRELEKRIRVKHRIRTLAAQRTRFSRPWRTGPGQRRVF